jgi:hypothetical protein
LGRPRRGLSHDARQSFHRFGSAGWLADHLKTEMVRTKSAKWLWQ